MDTHLAVNQRLNRFDSYVRSQFADVGSAIVSTLNVYVEDISSMASGAFLFGIYVMVAYQTLTLRA